MCKATVPRRSGLLIALNLLPLRKNKNRENELLGSGTVAANKKPLVDFTHWKGTSPLRYSGALMGNDLLTVKRSPLLSPNLCGLIVCKHSRPPQREILAIPIQAVVGSLILVCVVLLVLLVCSLCFSFFFNF